MGGLTQPCLTQPTLSVPQRIRPAGADADAMLRASSVSAVGGVGAGANKSVSFGSASASVGSASAGGPAAGPTALSSSNRNPFGIDSKGSSAGSQGHVGSSRGHHYVVGAGQHYVVANNYNSNNSNPRMSASASGTQSQSQSQAEPHSTASVSVASSGPRQYSGALQSTYENQSQPHAHAAPPGAGAGAEHLNGHGTGTGAVAFRDQHAMIVRLSRLQCRQVCMLATPGRIREIVCRLQNLWFRTECVIVGM